LGEGTCRRGLQPISLEFVVHGCHLQTKDRMTLFILHIIYVTVDTLSRKGTVFAVFD
jgi:hypothetical protein